MKCQRDFWKSRWALSFHFQVFVYLKEHGSMFVAKPKLMLRKYISFIYNWNIFLHRFSQILWIAKKVSLSKHSSGVGSMRTQILLYTYTNAMRLLLFSEDCDQIKVREVFIFYIANIDLLLGMSLWSEEFLYFIRFFHHGF